MLYLIAVWLTLGIATGLIGTALIYALQAHHWLLRPGDRLIVALWLGTLFLAIALLALSLAWPLSPLLGLLLLVSTSGSALLLPYTRQELSMLIQGVVPTQLAVMGAIVSLVALLFSQPVAWIDTGYYHYGMIRWLADYGAVPGLALLSKTLGFTSAWFALAAPFNPPVLHHSASAVANGFVLLLAMLQWSHSLLRTCTQRAMISDWFVVILFSGLLSALIGTPLLSVVLVSPSPDIPTILLTGVIAWVLLLLPEQRGSLATETKPDETRVALIPVLLAAGAVTIKLTALPLLAIAISFYGFAQQWYRRVPLAILVSLGMLAPMLLVSAVTTGCPAYPSTLLCLNLPWSSNPEEVEQVAAAVHGWQTWFGAPPQGVIAPLWLLGQWLNLNHSNKAIAVLTLLSLVLLVVMVRRIVRRQQWSYSWVMALGGLGTIFALLKAPLLRFSLGYVLLIPALGLVMLLPLRPLQPDQLAAKLKPRPHQHPPSPMGLIAATMAMAISLGYSYWQTRLILPPSLHQPQVSLQQINDVSYVSPQNDRGICWAAPLPCTGNPDIDIHLRRPAEGFSAGFVRKTSPRN